MVAACTGNASFTGIAADVTALGTATTALVAKMNAAQSAQSAAQQATMELNTSADDWNAKVETVFLAVEKLAHGDPATLLSANVPVYEPGQAQAVGPLPEPANFSVTQGDLPATLDGSWDPVHGANGYVLQVTTTADVPASWKQAAISTKSSCTLAGLATGTTYFVRVCAFGPMGNGPYTPQEQKVAP
jgi:outer membrane murein-binding lipoprotein Lpp